MRAKGIKSRVEEYFFMHPTARLRVRQLERSVGVPLPSVIRYVRELEAEGVIKSAVVAGVMVFSADRSSAFFLLEKKLFNLRSLYLHGLIDYIVEEGSSPVVVLFGSFARGEDVEDSDIDLYVEAPEGKFSGLKRFEGKLGRKIQLFCYNKVTDVRNKELANNIVNGIVLNGFLEVFR